MYNQSFPNKEQNSYLIKRNLESFMQMNNNVSLNNNYNFKSISASEIQKINNFNNYETKNFILTQKILFPNKIVKHTKNSYIQTKNENGKNSFYSLNASNIRYPHYLHPMNLFKICDDMESKVFSRIIDNIPLRKVNYTYKNVNPQKTNEEELNKNYFKHVSKKNSVGVDSVSEKLFIKNNLEIQNSFDSVFSNFKNKNIFKNITNFKKTNPIELFRRNTEEPIQLSISKLSPFKTKKDTGSIESKDDSKTIQKNFNIEDSLRSMLILPKARNVSFNKNFNSSRTIHNKKNNQFFYNLNSDKRNSLKKKTSSFFNNDNISENSENDFNTNIPEIMKTMSKVIYDRSLRRNKNKLICSLTKTLHNFKFKMTHLVGFKNLLYKFMRNEEIKNEDLTISNFEKLLFCLFLVKKRYLDLEAIEWTTDSLNSFRNQDMLKRSEQNYKVILKRAFKTLIACFNSENSVLRGTEKDFYEYYFKEVADNFNIPLENFKPQKIFNELKEEDFSSNQNLLKRKSKKEFARILKKSPKFMSVLNKYLNDDLLVCDKTEGIFKDCMKELERKLPLMIFNWQKKLGNEENFNSELINFLADTLMNDKVKLPWSAGEVTKGVTSVLRLFRKS